MLIGVPRVLSYYYLSSVYRKFLDGIGVSFIESPDNVSNDLQRMDLCPTDEPCVSVKLAFPRARNLLDRGADAIFIPQVVSLSPQSYCCPKMIGLPHMVRCGMALSPNQVISPVIDLNDNRALWHRTWLAAARQLGARDMRKVEDVLKEVHRELRQLNGPSGCSLFHLQVTTAGQTRHPEAATGIIGHAYLLNDIMGKRVVETVRRYGPVVTAEDVPAELAFKNLEDIPDGRKLWMIEGRLLGGALHLLRNRMVARMIFVYAFSCGPASIIESYLYREAALAGTPFLVLTLDEHTGMAGIITRLEAFMDLTEPGRWKPRTCRVTGWASLPVWSPAGSKKIGVVNMGNLRIPLETLFNEVGVEAAFPSELSDNIVRDGRALAPEFICYPMVTLLGQMMELGRQGIDRILMIQGKGRCRLGWYAQVMENILRQHGYNITVLSVDSPFPLAQKWQAFADVCRQIMGRPVAWRLGRALGIAGAKLALLDRAEEVLRDVRSVETNRGSGDARYLKFVEELRRASSGTSILAAYRSYLEDMASIPRDQVVPLHVGLIGEIYVLNEPYVNKQVEKILGSMDIRVRVYRDLNVTGWVSLHLLKTPGAVLRHARVVRAASAYLPANVGGHGQESVGEAVLGATEGMDGFVHLFPFTCMPETVAQSILARVSQDFQTPVLSLVVSEQTGTAGLVTRLEAFCDLLEGRRRSRQNATSQRCISWDRCR